MKTVQVRFRKTVFDITHDDGIIDTIVYNGQEVQGLMFDMGFLGDLTTALLETIASDEMDAAQHAVEAAREMEYQSTH
jgi:hypothetical protein